jgi:hypothetical protein
MLGGRNSLRTADIQVNGIPLDRYIKKPFLVASRQKGWHASCDSFLLNATQKGENQCKKEQ